MTKAINIDVSKVQTTDELHNLLSQAFSFPDYYVKNWDAFEECIGDIPCPEEIFIKGFDTLKTRLPRDANFLGFILEDFVLTRADKEVSFNVG